MIAVCQNQKHYFPFFDQLVCYPIVYRPVGRRLVRQYRCPESPLAGNKCSRPTGFYYCRFLRVRYFGELGAALRLYFDIRSIW